MNLINTKNDARVPTAYFRRRIWEQDRITYHISQQQHKTLLFGVAKYSSQAYILTLCADVFPHSFGGCGYRGSCTSLAKLFCLML